MATRGDQLTPEERAALDAAPMSSDDFLGIAPGERLHPILSNDEFLEAQAAARRKLDAERKKAAMKDVEAKEMRRLRTEEGLVSGITDEDELVWVTIDLPEWAPWIAVNGRPYWHGYSGRVPKHVYRSLAEQMQTAWRAHDQTEGRSIAQMMQSKRATTLNGKTGVADNAPRRFDA